MRKTFTFQLQLLSGWEDPVMIFQEKDLAAGKKPTVW